MTIKQKTKRRRKARPQEKRGGRTRPSIPDCPREKRKASGGVASFHKSACKKQKKQVCELHKNNVAVGFQHMKGKRGPSKIGRCEIEWHKGMKLGREGFSRKGKKGR